MTKIAFACIVKSDEPLDDDTDPATWEVLGVTAKNLDLMGGVNTVSGFYLPLSTQFATVAGERICYCYHTTDAALQALDRARASYGEYRGRIAAAERDVAELRYRRSQYVRETTNTSGLKLQDAVTLI